MNTGKVFLVGAGPGDPGLITVKGLNAIKKADVILYDRLSNPKLLEFAERDCELIYCGKLPDRHTLRQENINGLLVEKALAGNTVVRLKGGDPGVFGRVGEEAAALAHYKIPFEIVPGISSGIAAPLYAGIPVTHREHAESFAVVTAHDKSENGKPLLDWEGLARGVDTIAFYMGVGNLPYICENLIHHGKPASTPVILIHWGTLGRQKTLQGTLANIAERAVAEKFRNPSIILVGDVISLREKISWFEQKPLYGREILLARTGDSVSELSQEFMNQGADVIEFPKWKRTILSVDVTKVTSYDHILFTSPESVTEFFTALFEQGLDIRTIHARLYGASSKSVRVLNKLGLMAKLAEDMPVTGKRLIVGEEGMVTHDNADKLFTSKKELDRQFIPIFKRMLEEADVNTMLFPSSASVAQFVEGLRECEIDATELLANLDVVSMGKQTMAAVTDAGLPQSEMPPKATKEALISYLAGQTMGGE